MDKNQCKLTVLFEDPFWIGIFEKIEGNRLSVCKVTFGEEPKDYEIYDYIQKNYDSLKFSPSVETEIKETKVNPKKMQRDIKKSLERASIGTKSQQALKLQQEQRKLEIKAVKKERKEDEEKRLFLIRQQKKKEKHKGR